jgi:hypothetical protein
MGTTHIVEQIQSHQNEVFVYNGILSVQGTSYTYDYIEMYPLDTMVDLRTVKKTKELMMCLWGQYHDTLREEGYTVVVTGTFAKVAHITPPAGNSNGGSQ